MYRLIIIFFFIVFNSMVWGQRSYQKYFTEQALRIDFYHVGDKEQEIIIWDHLYQEARWAGNPHHLLDSLNLGHYLLRVYDLKTNMLIFSYGFCSLFQEWQTTSEALEGGHKVIPATLRIPFPLNKIQLEILRRDKQNLFSRLIAQRIINPQTTLISTESRSEYDQLLEIQKFEDPAQMVDLLFLGEGYTAEQAADFENDVRRLNEKLFTIEPFRSYKSKFNIFALLAFSREVGVDHPSQKVFKNTPLNFSFSTFGSQRYLMSADNKSINDLAAAVPFDVLVILVNTDTYGGGGIYNLYTSVAAKNSYSTNILVHELGHSFAGLGDEYYTSDVAYHNFYPLSVEPWEPNLTILQNPAAIKWQELIDPGMPIPTPWNKEKYDHWNKTYQQQSLEMSKAGKSHRELNKLRKDHEEAINRFFDHHPYREKIGAFEGAGYVSEGIYRPSLECLMFSNRKLVFDRVCQQAIERRIIFLTQ